MGKKKSVMVSWSEDSYKEGGIKYSAACPFDTDELKYDLVSITRFNERAKLLSVGLIPQQRRVLESLIKIEDSFRWIMAKLDGQGLITPDTKLAIETFVGEDYPTHGDKYRAFFDNGKLVAVSGVKGIGSQGKEINLEEVFGIPCIGIYAEEDLVKLFSNIVRIYARKSGFSSKRDPFLVFKSFLKADSPCGKGLHNPYREAIRDIL